MVEIDTPQGVRSGSSAMRVRYGIDPNINGGGQQADVDLGCGRHVVALLGQAPMQSGAFERRFLPAEVFYPEVSGLQQVQALKASGGNLQGSAELTGDQIPSMATFGWLADPAVTDSPGGSRLPALSRLVSVLLRSGRDA